MKRRIKILSLLVFILVLTCCSDKENECYDCECYAPTGAKVSWTDYNSVADMHAYFNHHDSTLMQHIGDTIRFCGWVYYPDEEAGEPLYGVMIPDWSVEVGTIFLVDSDNHHFNGNYGSAYVRWPTISSYMTHEDSVWYEEHADFVDHFSEFLLKKWYVTVLIEYFSDLGIGYCANYAPRYRLIEMDTINMIMP